MIKIAFPFRGSSIYSYFLLSSPPSIPGPRILPSDHYENGDDARKKAEARKQKLLE